MKARVLVSLKAGVLDPQGKAIERALTGLGFSGVGEVRQGKHIEIELTESDPAAARAALEQMCRKLLANTVIETYRIELGDGPVAVKPAVVRPAAAKPVTPKPVAPGPKAAAPKRAPARTKVKAKAKAPKAGAKPAAKPARKATGRTPTKARPRSKSAPAKRR